MGDLEKQWHTTSAVLLKTLVILWVTAGIVLAAIEPHARPTASEVVRAAVIQRHLTDISQFLERFVGSRAAPPYYAVHRIDPQEFVAARLRDLKSRVEGLVSLDRELLQLDGLRAVDVGHVCQTSGMTVPQTAIYYTEFIRVVRERVIIPQATNKINELIATIRHFGLVDKEPHDISVGTILAALRLLGGGVDRDLDSYLLWRNRDRQWFCESHGIEIIRRISQWGHRQRRIDTPWHANISEIWALYTALQVDDPVMREAAGKLPGNFENFRIQEQEKYRSLLRRYSLSSPFQLEKYIPKVSLYWIIVALPLWISGGYILMLLQVTVLHQNVGKDRAAGELFAFQSVADRITLAWSRPKIGLLPALVIMSPALAVLGLYAFALISIDRKSIALEILQPEIVEGALLAVPTQTEIHLIDILSDGQQLMDLSSAHTLFLIGTMAMTISWFMLYKRISVLKRDLLSVKI